MTIKFHLLDAIAEIPAHLKVDIVRELEAANERIAHFIQLNRLDIVVAPEAASAAPGKSLRKRRFDGHCRFPWRWVWRRRLP